jgi:hypothetical protein
MFDADSILAADSALSYEYLTCMHSSCVQLICRTLKSSSSSRIKMISQQDDLWGARRIKLSFTGSP